MLVFIDFYSTDCLIGFIFQNKSCKCYNSPLKVSSVKLMNLTSLNKKSVRSNRAAAQASRHGVHVSDQQHISVLHPRNSPQ